MDLQEQVRMEDTYHKLNKIVDDISDVSVFPSLVWVWCWDVIRSLYKDYHDFEDDEYTIKMSLEDIFKLFWAGADNNGFTLEYGSEEVFEHIRSWMIDNDILVSVESEQEEV